MEIWTDIKNYEGKYQISNLGNVRSFAHNGNAAQSRWNTRVIKRRTEPKILKNTLNKGNGYFEVSLMDNFGKRKNRCIHQLVAETFLFKQSDNQIVCHRNDLKTDNRLENLMYGDVFLNKTQAIANGKCKKGTEVSNHKLNEDDICKIKEQFFNGIIKAQIARNFGISKQHVDRILKGKVWRHIHV